MLDIFNIIVSVIRDACASQSHQLAGSKHRSIEHRIKFSLACDRIWSPGRC